MVAWDCYGGYAKWTVMLELVWWVSIDELKLVNYLGKGHVGD